MNELDVSVIVLTYYHEQYIERALDSILSQETTYSYEIIVSDDCSGDSTVDILRRYQARYPDKIKLITYDENVGTCQNLYNALLACKGKYIEITAGDDMWPIEDKIQRQVDFLDNNLDFFANCVLAEGRYTDGSLTGQVFPLNKQRWGKEFPLEALLSGESFCDAGVMIRNVFNQQKAIEEFGMLPKLSKYIEDLPMDFMFYDFGKVYISDYVGYAITHRRAIDTNQHNYNTMFKGYKQAIDHIKLIKNMQTYFDDRYDLSAWLVPRMADAVAVSVRMCKPSILADIPKMDAKYWRQTFVLLGKRLVRKITKH